MSPPAPTVSRPACRGCSPGSPPAGRSPSDEHLALHGALPAGVGSAPPVAGAGLPALLERGRARRPARPRRGGLSPRHQAARGRRRLALAPCGGAARSWSSTVPRASPRPPRTARCCAPSPTSCSTAPCSPPPPWARTRFCSASVSPTPPRSTPARSRSPNAGLPGAGGRVGFDSSCVAVPARYVAGQESALVIASRWRPRAADLHPPAALRTRACAGGPRWSPTSRRSPTSRCSRGTASEWFRELGTPAQPGSALVTLSGPVAFPGVYEIEHGSPLLGAARRRRGRHGAAARGAARRLLRHLGRRLATARPRALRRTPRAPRRDAWRRRRRAALRRRLPRRRGRSARPLARFGVRPPVRALRVRARRPCLRVRVARARGRPRCGGVGARNRAAPEGGVPSTRASRRSPGSSAAAAPARTPTAPPASSRAPSTCSPRSWPLTPFTAPAPPVLGPPSCPAPTRGPVAAGVLTPAPPRPAHGRRT